MATLLQTGLHAAQAGYAGYNLYLAYLSITNLQQYEDQTKRAAKYVNEAAYRLRKTRTTQAAGTLAVCLSYSTLRLILTIKASIVARGFALLDAQVVSAHGNEAVLQRN